MNGTNIDNHFRYTVHPDYDPWDPIRSLEQHGKHVLTSVEMTVSNVCNMRCEHCAVGDSLVLAEGRKLPVEFMLKRLDEVEYLETISITGGEPTFREDTVNAYILPLLKYAKERGIKSQINSNLTLDLHRYEQIAPYLDVMHISYNYTNVDDFVEVGFARSEHPIPRHRAESLFVNMVENAKALAKGGLLVSAESMLNYRTHHKIADIHHQIVEMGCMRHEVHPMYPSAFAAHLPILSLEETRQAIHRLLDARDSRLWMLFGTLPFFHCNEEPRDQALLSRLKSEPNVTVRNDPDGRNRLNVDLFNGNIHVTDFADLPPLGNIHQDKLDEVFNLWLEHPLNQTVNCHCEAVKCCGPNLLVADTYYKSVNFKQRHAIPSLSLGKEDDAAPCPFE